MAKKKILLLSDDLRMTSGIATVSKEFVSGTMDRFHWIQLGAAIKHPDQGKEIDLGEDMRKLTGIDDASLKIVPWTGYGDANILRQLIMRHQPDAILHFTDPRYWRWLYEMEAELRQNIPILFYHIWDDLPDPDYNRNYYESCDWLGCISRQTYGIVSRVGKIDSETIQPLEDWQVSYVPHGINSETYKPTIVPEDFRKQVTDGKDYKFILFWMNRNIKRKESNNINMSILALKDCINHLKEKQNFIPFRRSLLTLLLKDMFNGKSTISMICTISFHQPLYQQIDSMRYITDIKDITFHETAHDDYTNSHKIISIHDEYIKYINEVEWCACQERELCRKIKQNTITTSNLAKIENYLQRKLNGINKFKSFFKKYKQIYHE